MEVRDIAHGQSCISSALNAVSSSTRNSACSRNCDTSSLSPVAYRMAQLPMASSLLLLSRAVWGVVVRLEGVGDMGMSCGLFFGLLTY